MSRITFVKGFENESQFQEGKLLLIISHILSRAGFQEDVYVPYSDIDRIFLCCSPDADADMEPDYIIRTWNYYICDENPNIVHIEWTLHKMGESPDLSGRCSVEQINGEYDILVFGDAGRNHA